MVIVFISLVVAPQVFAKEAFPTELSETIAHYSSAKGLHIELEKKVKLAVLDRETAQQGRAMLSLGRLRLEFDEPNRALVIVNKNDLWFVTYPPQDLGGDVQVGHAKRNSSKQPPVLYNLLAGRDPAKDFTVSATQAAGEHTRYELQAKLANPDMKKMTIEIDAKKKEISALTYWDELENQTSYTFTKSDFSPQLEAKLFQYILPKNIKATEY